MVIENLTPTIQQEADAVDVESKEASKKLKDRRPVFNFLEMSIPIGSSLNFTQSNDITVDVATERKVIFKDEILSLTAVTRELLGNSYDVSPGAYWLFEGRLLRDIYNATYEMQ